VAGREALGALAVEVVVRRPVVRQEAPQAVIRREVPGLVVLRAVVHRQVLRLAVQQVEVGPLEVVGEEPEARLEVLAPGQAAYHSFRKTLLRVRSRDRMTGMSLLLLKVSRQ
jgi:hypothetical protein